MTEDPDALLAKMRSLHAVCSGPLVRADDKLAAAVMLAGMFGTLDAQLSDGGMLPLAWVQEARF